jgi:hypothetical protein
VISTGYFEEKGWIISRDLSPSTGCGGIRMAKLAKEPAGSSGVLCRVAILGETNEEIPRRGLQSEGIRSVEFKSNRLTLLPC